MRADMFRHASHLLHLQVKSIGHRVTEAIVHYLGSNIFVFILFYNLYLVHYTFCLKCIFWSVKATCGQNVNCMHVTILPFVDNGYLGSDDHAQDHFFLRQHRRLPVCVCTPQMGRDVSESKHFQGHPVNWNQEGGRCMRKIVRSDTSVPCD